jgi:hypothetical protein
MSILSRRTGGRSSNDVNGAHQNGTLSKFKAEHGFSCGKSSSEKMENGQALGRIEVSPFVRAITSEVDRCGVRIRHDE